jgi:hypothetical protein
MPIWIEHFGFARYTLFADNSTAQLALMLFIDDSLKGTITYFTVGLHLTIVGDFEGLQQHCFLSP